MVFRSPCTAALAALATRSWRLSGRQEEKEAATTASRIRPTVRIRLVGEENLFQARVNHWSTSRVRSGATRDCASDVWPVPGGSPSTDLPEGVTWKTLRHFLQTRRVRTLSLGARPSAPQAGHLIAIIWNCPPRITQASSQNWSIRDSPLWGECRTQSGRVLCPVPEPSLAAGTVTLCSGLGKCRQRPIPNCISPCI